MPPRRKSDQDAPEKSADPLADLREPEPNLATDGPKLPPSTPTPAAQEPAGEPVSQEDMVYLYAATSAQEAVQLALMQATPETMDTLEAELMALLGKFQPGGTAPLEAPGQVLAVGSPLVAQDDQDRARNLMIQTWHEDTVCTGFVHKGGVCGCNYLAQTALRVVMPALPEADPES